MISKIIYHLWISFVIIFTACDFSEQKYFVAFNSNGGSYENSIIISVKPGYEISFPENPEKEGFVFLGWFTVEGEEFLESTAITQDITLYAKWGKYPFLKIVSLPKKLNYLMGEPINLEGLLIYQFENRDSIEVKDYCIQGNTFTAGEHPVLVILNEDTTQFVSFQISVSNELINTGLPVIYIETLENQPIDSKENYINGTMFIKKENTIIHQNMIRIKGRGNATWRNPKKPYRIKLNTKTDLLNMGKEEDWVLLANYTDKTLLRTSIGLKLSEVMSFSWTPKAEFVELILNGNYVGNYLLVEQVKRSDKRINISESGYIIENNAYYLQEPKWFSSISKYTDYNYGNYLKYPSIEDLTESQWLYIKNYIEEFESVLNSDDFNHPEIGYQKYIDLGSFAKWLLFQNILANMDTNRYLTKQDNTDSSKLSVGPVWDFEYSLGIGWYEGERPRSADYWVQNGWYYTDLMRDHLFIEKIKFLWNADKIKIQQLILSYIENISKEIQKSQKLNFQRWDVLNERLNEGGIPLGSFEAELECDKLFLVNRLLWLDAAINAL